MSEEDEFLFTNNASPILIKCHVCDYVILPEGIYYDTFFPYYICPICKDYARSPQEIKRLEEFHSRLKERLEEYRRGGGVIFEEDEENNGLILQD